MPQLMFSSFSQFLNELNEASAGRPGPDAAYGLAFAIRVEAFLGASAANHREGKLFVSAHVMAVNLPWLNVKLGVAVASRSLGPCFAGAWSI